MILMPILLVSDVVASTAFYQRLGFPVRLRGRVGNWVELDAGDGTRLGIHPRIDDGEGAERFRLSLVADRPLEELAAELEREGIVAPDGIVDEAYGCSMLIHDPDGMPIEIIELDEELYT